MDILVLSDSHGAVAPMVRAVELAIPDLILHLGDCWRDGERLRDRFPDIPLEQVPGNCDFLSDAPTEQLLVLGGKRILMCHGHTYRVKTSLLLAGFAACVVLLTLCVSFYFFPMLAMVDLPLGALLKNSMALVFGNIGKTLLALLLFVLLIGLGVGLLPYSFIFAALIMFSFVASITTYLTYPAIEARVMRREEGHAAGELYQTLPQQEQPEVQLRSAGLDELRFEDDETEENAEN